MGPNIVEIQHVGDELKIERLDEICEDGREMCLVKVNGKRYYGKRSEREWDGMIHIWVPSLYKTYEYPKINA